MTATENMNTSDNNNNNVGVLLNNNNNSNNNNGSWYSSSSKKKGEYGETAMRKVFVGGLAWETPLEALRHHFDRFGDIIEAVIISDKLTGRSKGYGFVTFKETEAAKKACEDATPMINGRRANCNLAALGARRPPRSASATPPPPLLPPNNIIAASRPIIGNNGMWPTTPPPGHVQWYYPPPTTTTTPFHPHPHPQAISFYGYSPSYVATDVNYNNLRYSSGGAGSYMKGQVQYPEMYGGAGNGQAVIGANTLMPYYPVYYHQHQQLQQSHNQGVGLMGLPAHMLRPTSAGPITPLSIVSARPTPVSISSPSGTLWSRRELDRVKLSKDEQNRNE